jgi:hypothetical protein
MSGSWNPDLVEGESTVDRDMMPCHGICLLFSGCPNSEIGWPVLYKDFSTKLLSNFGASSPPKKELVGNL